ncbi:response regulator transcription factor [Parasphingorhabdus sp.]|uniref:response regulator transcription factor n=1 Tax=Parasphingorhabdus sp. TaxID=2709688 RepID=UPI003002CB72
MLQQENLTNGPNLTARETEILEYIAQGLSTKEVAQLIDIAARTIDRHVENIRLKLRAKNRTHMVACAVMEGLLQVENDKGKKMAGKKATRSNGAIDNSLTKEK